MDEQFEAELKRDLEAGDAAARPFYLSAGALLVEAREGHFNGNSAGFYKWAKKTFGIGTTDARFWMASALAAGCPGAFDDAPDAEEI